VAQLGCGNHFHGFGDLLGGFHTADPGFDLLCGNTGHVRPPSLLYAGYEFCQKLIGTPHTIEAIRATLEEIPTASYFNNISVEEIVGMFFE
jgi:hypothetical protein